MLGRVPLDFAHRGDIWYCIVGRKSLDAAVYDYLFYSSASRNEGRDLQAVANILADIVSAGLKAPQPVMVGEKTRMKTAGKFPAIWFNDDFTTLQIVPGQTNEVDLSFLKNPDLVLAPSYPVYHSEMPEFQKSMIITRGLCIRPPVEASELASSAVNAAYSKSFNVSKEVIRRDITSFIERLVKSGTFIQRGNYIFYPYDESTFRRRYVRRYLGFMDKIRRTTIFDFP